MMGCLDSPKLRMMEFRTGYVIGGNSNARYFYLSSQATRSPNPPSETMVAKIITIHMPIPRSNTYKDVGPTPWSVLTVPWRKWGTFYFGSNAQRGRGIASLVN
jgi:hypothetical protein